MGHMVVADWCALPDRFKNYGDRIARNPSHPARNVFPHRDNRIAYTWLSGAARVVLPLYEEEPV